MRRRTTRSLAVLAVLGLALASACSSDDPDEATDSGGDTTEAAGDDGGDGGGGDGAAEGEFFVQADYDNQLAQRDVEPEGDAETPWLQAIEPEEADTAEFALDGAGTLCFSNASISNPWRQTGWITMQQQVEVLTEEGVIDDFQVADAADDDSKQISDIEAFVDSGECDALIISPSTTATLTPAVEAACESGIPVIVFDRGVNTDCMVTFIHPIGGYAYGADGAEFLVENLEPGSTVLALRILPGVDVLENRWAAAQEIFADSELEILGDEFTEGDGANIKDIVTQYIDGDMTDTSAYKSEGAKKVCFANASISNPWRQTGWITMNQQLKQLQDEGVISEMETRDAEDDDNTQISDIDYFISEGNCDAFIISPNSTAAMTPGVERACDTGKPVVVFDRGIDTDCATTFIHPIGGYAWGIDTAEFLIDNLEEGDKVVALRILPGVDVLEQRWAAAEKLFDEAGIEATDYFTGADPTEIKKIISDELAKGDVQGVWMDAGDGAVAAIEAFEDFGADYPVMTGEDEMSFLRKWEDTGLTGLAPVYSNFQWRTPLLAVQKIFAGEEVPSEWVLPQVPITEDERADYLAANEGMPDGHYAKFGGEDLPGYPEVWQERQIP